MPNFKPLQMNLLDDVLLMGDGYVLSFSNRTFAEFFLEELGINIDDPKFSVMGGSKGKRMRYFLQNSPRPIVVKALNALWEYRMAAMERTGEKESIPDVHRKMASLVQSIGGMWGHQPATERPTNRATIDEVSPNTSDTLMSRFTEMLTVSPQRRGYEFESFLKDLFDAYGMESRDPFRIRGEQIDGSFQLEGATYLLEAKWQNSKAGASDLRAFHGKVRREGCLGSGSFR